MLKMLREADRSSILTLLGTILIKFAAGICGIWGATNIYFFSYLKNKGTEITALTNSILLLCTIVPSVIAMLIATTLSRKFGYKLVIRACGLLFAVVPLIVNLKINLFVLGFCYLLLPVSLLSISSVAVLNCLWSQFPKHLNKVSGIAVLSFSLGSIVFNLLFVTFTNPNNQPAIIDEEQQAYFPPKVADNIFKATNINFLISGIAYMIGGLLITKREQENSSSAAHIHELAEESPHPIQTEVQTQKNQKETPKNGDIVVPTDKEIAEIKVLDQKQIKAMRLRDTLSDKKFMILLWISYLVPLYMIYLNLYMKLIFMPVLNDDHFLAFCAVIITVGGITAAPIWGCIGDQKGFKSTLLIFVVSDLISKILGLFCNEKWNIALMYLFLSFNDKALITMIGPGLIDMFGLEMATELIPYKGISVCMAYITVPVFQIIMPDYSAYKTLLGMFVCLSLVAFFLAIYFYGRVEYTKYSEKGRRLSKEILQQNLQTRFP